MKSTVENVRKQKLDRIKAAIVCWQIKHFLFFNITKRVFYSDQEHIVCDIKCYFMCNAQFTHAQAFKVNTMTLAATAAAVQCICVQNDFSEHADAKKGNKNNNNEQQKNDNKKKTLSK